MTTTKPLGAWTNAENAILAAAYVRMLDAELAGDKYNKAATRRAGLAAMASSRDDKAERSAGSWEMKCCNASAVMNAAGLRYIDGYKPLGHGQAAALRHALAVALDQFANRSRQPTIFHAAADCLRSQKDDHQ